MEVVLGALPSLLPKLAELLKDEYNLQKEARGGIRFLQAELESMKAALEHISKIPPEQLPNQDKIWARNVRELSYDIEDSIDTFMVQAKQASEPAKKHGLIKKLIDKTLGTLMQPKIRRKIATEIRDIKARVAEVHERRRRYEVNHISVDKPIKVDPRALVRYEDVRKLVGIDEARDEVIKLLMEGDELSKEQDKIVSIVGFGGLGKTTLANLVYEKLRAQFDCSAFVSVSQTPDMEKLFKDMFGQLASTHNAPSINVIDELRAFLREKRYLVVIDDIWEISYWNIIRCALPKNSHACCIITTTRILSVAEQIGGAYRMKPLSLKNSRILMYGRIFGNENKVKGLCADEHLAEVSDKILSKCAGVPLAIITIASLLASKGRNKMEWYNVCNSIGAGLEENDNVENMRKVLSLSYYDMPPHLRTCLLYLSMFPEDYRIAKDRLIWLWIAEGLIQPSKQEKRLFEIGESYLYELVNRSMIQLMDNRYTDRDFYCVHDMVLDLIHSLSGEENFVTVWNSVGRSFASEKVRRLSLQSVKVSHRKPVDTMSMGHVRSLVVFPSATHQVPTLENFIVLRVLDLEGCDLSQGYSLKCLEKLLLLRYLGLSNTDIDMLPEELGNLRFLQTLDVRDNRLSSLPSTTGLLTHLMCLQTDDEIRVPKGIGNLTALEDLCLCIQDDSAAHIIEEQELGHLTELRVLRVTRSSTYKWNSTWDKPLVECLNKLHKIQKLHIIFWISVKCNLDGWDFVNPRHLQELLLQGCIFSTLPAWVNPSLLPDLSILEIRVKGLQQEDLEILGRLPALHRLILGVGHEALGIHERFTVGACSFPCLVHCLLSGFGGPVVFQKGAMPKLERLSLFRFPVHKTREINGGFDLGLGNLPSLLKFDILFLSGDAGKEEVEEAEAAVKHAIQVHPNHPTLNFHMLQD